MGVGKVRFGLQFFPIETPDLETYVFVRDRIAKYQLAIDINSKALKNKMIEVNTTLKFEDKEPNEKKSYYEIIYAVIVRIENEIKDKKDLEKIILCDVPSAVYPDLEKAFLDLIHHSGHSGLKFEKKVDFYKLFSEKIN